MSREIIESFAKANVAMKRSLFAYSACTVVSKSLPMLHAHTYLLVSQKLVARQRRNITPEAIRSLDAHRCTRTKTDKLNKHL
jgi:hypothetical protein